MVKKQVMRYCEIRLALDIADEKPDNTIFIIPLRLEDCRVPERLKRWHWIDYFGDKDAHFDLLIESLTVRATALGIEIREHMDEADVEPPNLYQFIYIESDVAVPYPYWIAKYPVTNFQYRRFIESTDIRDPNYWSKIPKYDKDCNQIGYWDESEFEGTVTKPHVNDNKTHKPRFWDDRVAGINRKYVPVVGISWFDAYAYCKWLQHQWNALDESRANPQITFSEIRLPTEKEWIKAAGGMEPIGRFPWDRSSITKRLYEAKRFANLGKAKDGYTTSVDKYPEGASPYGIMDMSGNVWEWQANPRRDFEPDLIRPTSRPFMVVKGGSFRDKFDLGRVTGYTLASQSGKGYNIGFRIVLTEMARELK